MGKFISTGKQQDRKGNNLTTNWIIPLLPVILLLLLSIQSCKGCVNVKSTVNIGSSSDSGSISVAVQGIPRPAKGTTYLSITVNGILVSGTGGSGRTSFSDARTYEVTAGNINPAPLVTREDLKPGRWRITVSSGGWTAGDEGNITKQKSLSFTFTYNTSTVRIQ